MSKSKTTISRIAFTLMMASAAFAQTHRVIFVHAPTSNSPSMNVTITSLPNTVGGTTVNLSSATEDWRFFGNSGISSPTTARTDRQANGSGIQGVFNSPLGTDHNFYSYGHTLPALNISWNDGTVSSSGTFSSLSLFPNSSYALSVPADNQVTKTFTTYWAVYNYLYSTPTKSGDDTVRFTFALSDSSVAPITRDVAVSSASQNGFLKIVVTYTAASDGQNLMMTAAKLTNNDGNTAISAIAATLDSAATGAISRMVPASADFNSTLEACKPGETNVFPANYTWTGNAVLVPRPLVSDGNGSYLHCKFRAADVNLTTSTWDGTTLTRGQRVISTEPTITLTSPNTNAIITGLGAGIGNLDFDGMSFTSTSTTNYGFLLFAIAGVADHTTTTAALPHDITFSHVLIHAHDQTLSGAYPQHPTYNSQKGITFDVFNGAITDSVITNFIYDGVEAQAILIQGGKNVQILNNETTSNGETIMLNSAYVGYTSQTEANLVPIPGGMMPDNISMVGNWTHKDPAWIGLTFDKNLIECKTCRNSRMSGNLGEYSFEGYYSQGQHGTAFVANSRNGSVSGGDPLQRPWSWTHDVEMDHNILHHVGSCFQTSGPYDDKWVDGSGSFDPAGLTQLNTAIANGMGRVANINIHDNVCDDISLVWTTPSSTYGSDMSGGYQPMAIRGGAPDNLTVRHNTFLFRENPGQVISPGTQYGVTTVGYTMGTQSTNTFLPCDGNSGDCAAGLPGFPIYNTDITGQVYDSNIFGWGDPACNSTGSYNCFAQNGISATTFTNNALQHIWASVSGWNTFLTNSNSTYPGQVGRQRPFN